MADQLGSRDAAEKPEGKAGALAPLGGTAPGGAGLTQIKALTRRTGYAINHRRGRALEMAMVQPIEAWSRRAGLARRAASMLPFNDAEVLTRFAEDCELRVECLSRIAAIHPCNDCPLGREQPC